MLKGPNFNQFLISSVQSWEERSSDQSILSIALPMEGRDPLIHLPVLAANQQFRFLWDLSPELSIAAAGECQHLRLAGPKRFPLAQKFSDEVIGQLIDACLEAPSISLPRILFAFSFFDQNKSDQNSVDRSCSLHAVLPRWQLSLKGNAAWLRLNSVINQKSEIREIAEHIWIMREQLLKSSSSLVLSTSNRPVLKSVSQEWKTSYRASLTKGIDLVRNGELDKLVIAACQSIHLHSTMDPLVPLSRLRHQQTGSCRFLWQINSNQSFFGASPERLISLNKGQLRTDALAGTALRNDDGYKLLRSLKNLREHEFVVNSIIQQLSRLGLEPLRRKKPKLIRQGHLIHLHTPIYACSQSQFPLRLVQKLHPTPAVAGLPLKQAMNWIRTLELFERGSYAAPIGWIDSQQNAEFRVAIRCGYINGRHLDLIAGSGLVQGSTLEGELEEVQLKFEVLLNQLDLHKGSQFNSLSKHSMT